MPTAQEPKLTPEFATAYRDLMLASLSREMQTTKKVLAAVPDDKSEHRHDPNGRTAAELAWHIANTDVQFLEGIAGLKFVMEGERADQREIRTQRRYQRLDVDVTGPGWAKGAC